MVYGQKIVWKEFQLIPLLRNTGLEICKSSYLFPGMSGKSRFRTFPKRNACFPCLNRGKLFVISNSCPRQRIFLKMNYPLPSHIAVSGQ